MTSGVVDQEEDGDVDRPATTLSSDSVPGSGGVDTPASRPSSPINEDARGIGADDGLGASPDTHGERGTLNVTKNSTRS